MKNYNLLKLKEKIKIFFLDTINILYYIVLYCISNWLEGFFLAQKKVARTIYIKDEQLEALKRLSEKTKVPQSVYVREALDMLLEKYSEQLKFEFEEYFKG
jgi:predicted DNA-binding protein